jgi:hypothetical protein
MDVYRSELPPVDSDNGLGMIWFNKREDGCLKTNFTRDNNFVLLDVIFIRDEKVSSIWMENLKGRDHLQRYK